MAVGPDWLSQLQILSTAAAETLVAMARTLCPHDTAPEACYRRVVLTMDHAAADDPALAQTLADGAQALDAAQPLPFVDLSEGGRVAVLRAMQTTPFFVTMQRGVVRRLYDDPVIWSLCGYEGASHHLGGYRNRGFADLDWLPDPPTAVCEG